VLCLFETVVKHSGRVRMPILPDSHREFSCVIPGTKFIRFLIKKFCVINLRCESRCVERVREKKKLVVKKNIFSEKYLAIYSFLRPRSQQSKIVRL